MLPCVSMRRSCDEERRWCKRKIHFVMVTMFLASADKCERFSVGPPFRDNNDEIVSHVSQDSSADE